MHNKETGRIVTAVSNRRRVLQLVDCLMKEIVGIDYKETTILQTFHHIF